MSELNKSQEVYCKAYGVYYVLSNKILDLEHLMDFSSKRDQDQETCLQTERRNVRVKSDLIVKLSVELNHK